MHRIPDRKRPHITRNKDGWVVMYAQETSDNLVYLAHEWMWSTGRWRAVFGRSG